MASAIASASSAPRRSALSPQQRLGPGRQAYGGGWPLRITTHASARHAASADFYTDRETEGLSCVSVRPNGSFRYDGYWRKVRARVLDRDGGVCQLRRPRYVADATEIAHIVLVGALDVVCESQLPGDSNFAPRRGAITSATIRLLLDRGYDISPFLPPADRQILE